MKKNAKIISEKVETRGRKALPQGDLRRFCIPVKVSENEMAKLKELAESHGFTLTNYVRLKLGL